MRLHTPHAVEARGTVLCREITVGGRRLCVIKDDARNDHPMSQLLMRDHRPRPFLLS